MQVELGGAAITVLKSGSYFGEIGLLRNARRNATVRAISGTVDLFVLTKVGCVHFVEVTLCLCYNMTINTMFVLHR